MQIVSQKLSNPKTVQYYCKVQKKKCKVMKLFHIAGNKFIHVYELIC